MTNNSENPKPSTISDLVTESKTPWMEMESRDLCFVPEAYPVDEIDHFLPNPIFNFGDIVKIFDPTIQLKDCKEYVIVGMRHDGTRCQISDSWLGTTPHWYYALKARQGKGDIKWVDEDDIFQIRKIDQIDPEDCF